MPLCCVARYNVGAQNSGCTVCPNGHHQGRRGQGTDGPFPACLESCAWTNYYAFPAHYCYITWSLNPNGGSRKHRCEAPFSGTHCEIIGHDPAVLMVKVKAYSLNDPRAFLSRDFANTKHHDYLRPKADGGVMQVRATLPHWGSVNEHRFVHSFFFCVRFELVCYVTLMHTISPA